MLKTTSFLLLTGFGNLSDLMKAGSSPYFCLFILSLFSFSCWVRLSPVLMMKLFFLWISGPYHRWLTIWIYSFLSIIVKHLVKSDMQTHELSQWLLPQHSLCLQVHLWDGFRGQTSWSIFNEILDRNHNELKQLLLYFLPSTNAKLH